MAATEKRPLEASRKEALLGLPNERASGRRPRGKSPGHGKRACRTRTWVRAVEEACSDPAKARCGRRSYWPRAKPDLRRQEEVVRTLKAVAVEKEYNVFTRSNSVKALGVWGTEREVEFLVPLASDENIFVRSEASRCGTSWLGGTKAAETIASRVGNAHDHARVLKCLGRMGAAAEGAVGSVLLGSSNVPARLEGCQLLQAIRDGTRPARTERHGPRRCQRRRQAGRRDRHQCDQGTSATRRQVIRSRSRPVSPAPTCSLQASRTVEFPSREQLTHGKQ